MNPQGQRPPGGGQQPGQPGGYPPGPTPFDQQVTQQAQTFARPQQPPPTGGPQYTPPPPPGAPTPPPAPAPAPQPQPTGLAAKLGTQKWLIAGAVVAIAAAVVATLVLTGRNGDQDGAPTAATTSIAQVPAGPTTTAAGRPSVENNPTPPPAGSPAPPPPAGSPAPPPPAPTGPTLAPDALAGLLLSPADIDAQLGITGAAPLAPVETKPLQGTVEPPQCTGAWAPGYAGTYDGTGMTGIVVGLITQGQEVRITQAAASYPDPAAAQRIFDKMLADWTACQNTHAKFSFQGASTEVDIKTPRLIGDVHVLGLVPTTSPVPGQQCERGLTLRGNVIVDVRACSPTIGSGGLSITSAIADKIR